MTSVIVGSLAVVAILGVGVWQFIQMEREGQAWRTRIARSEELAQIIQDPKASRADRIEAGIELYDLSPLMADRLRRSPDRIEDWF